MSIYTPEQQQRMADASNMGANTVSTGYIYGTGNQTAADQMKSAYNDPNAVHQYNGTVALGHTPNTIAPGGYISPGVIGNPAMTQTAITQAQQTTGTNSTTPPPSTGNPAQDQQQYAAWYNQKESPWQNALDQAEQYRNYNNAYTNYASDQSHWIDSQGNPYNGSQADDHTVDWSKFTAPAWSGPVAYGLAGMKSGQSYDDANQAQVALQRIRQFDPNAQIVRQPSPFEGGGQDQYVLQFDQSKLPALANAQADTIAGPYGSNHLYNSNALAYDPNYGVMTNSKNIQEDQGPGWFKTVGMLAPVALAMMTGGMGTLPSLLMKAPGLIGNAVNGQFDPFQLANAALPFIPGVGSNPFLSTLSRVGLQAADSSRRGG